MTDRDLNVRRKEILLCRAEATLRAAERHLSRQLAAGAAVSEDEVEDAGHAVDLARCDRDLAALDLEAAKQ